MRVRLAHYTTESQQRRVLVAQRVNGAVRVTDEPLLGEGRCYLVERRLESRAAMEALVRDYLITAGRLGWSPMHSWP